MEALAANVADRRLAFVRRAYDLLVKSSNAFYPEMHKQAIHNFEGVESALKSAASGLRVTLYRELAGPGPCDDLGT